MNRLASQLIRRCSLTLAASCLAAGCLTVVESAIAQPLLADLPQAEQSSETVARINALHQQAAALFSQGQYDAALDLLQSALSVGTTTFGEKSIKIVDTLTFISAVYREKQDYAAAISPLEQSLSIQERSLGEEHLDLGTTLNYLSALYRDIGDNQRAMSLQERALSIQESQLGRDHLEVAYTLNGLALLYKDRFDYAEALPLFKRALAVREKALAPNHPDVAESLENLGRLYDDLGDYAAALPFLERSLSAQEAVLGVDSLEVAASLIRLGRAYRLSANYDAAQTSFERSLAIRETSTGAQSLEVSDSLSYLGVLHYEKGEYALALPLYERSLQIREAVLGKTHFSLVGELSNLGVLQSDLGNYDAALALFERALALEPPDLEADGLSASFMLGNMAGLYKRKGDYAQALALYEQNLTAIAATVGETHPEAATALDNMATLYFTQGDYTKALPLAERSLSIREASFGQGHPAVARSLTTLAQLYQAQGNYVATKPLLDRALRIQADTLDEGNPQRLVTLGSLAGWHQSQGDYAIAQSLFEEVLSIRERIFSEDHHSIATGLNNLAFVYQLQRQYEKARSLHERSLAITTATLGETHPDIASSLNNLALIYGEQGEYDRALALYERSLSVLQAALGDNHPSVIANLHNMAALYQKQGKFSIAVDLSSRASEIEEQNLTELLASASETRRQRYAVTLANSTNGYITLHLKESPDDKTAARLALTTLLRRKGRVLDAVSNSAQQLRQQLSPEDAKLLDALEAARGELATLRFDGLRNKPVADYRAALDKLETDAERLEEQISRQSALYRVETAPVSVESMQALIPGEAALVEFVRYAPLHFDDAQTDWNTHRYAAYVLSAQGNVEAVDLGEAAPIEQLIADFRLALSTRANNVETIARQLDERLIAPILPFLSGKTHLLLSPDSQLNLIPFDALVDSQNRYLVESYQISYLNSGRDLLKLQLNTPSRQAALVVADPDYEGGGTAGNGQRSVDASSLTFGPLPGTAAEGKAIASLLPSASLLTQRQATEAALKQIAGPNILHIATHGFFLPDVAFTVPDTDSRGASLEVVSTEEPALAKVTSSNLENPLLRSGLALAGANNRSSGGEDGIFTALEASGLDLYGTQLVVLSACETGVGAASSGEGVYGLRRAFAIAGAESQLMSLWQVDDTGTSELMQLYYNNLIEKKQGRSEALRNAQLEMINTGTYAHPYYWSSFIFSGDWRALK